MAAPRLTRVTYDLVSPIHADQLPFTSVDHSWSAAGMTADALVELNLVDASGTDPEQVGRNLPRPLRGGDCPARSGTVACTERKFVAPA